MFFEPPPPPQTVVVATRTEETVTASRAKVTVVTGEELRRTGERSLPRAIGQAAGVWIQESNLGGGAPILRGLFGNQILILVDGVRLNDATTRFGPNQSLNQIDPSTVERIEIVHGSAAVLYGSDAIGGVISIWTRRRPPAGPGAGGDGELHGSLEGRYDSAVDGWRSALDVSGATDRVGWLGVVSREDWGDLKTGGDDVPETGYDNVAAFASVDVRLDDARELRIVGSSHRDFDVPRTFSVTAGFGQPVAAFEKFDFALQAREQLLFALDDADGGLLGDGFQARLFVRRYEEIRESIRAGSSVEQQRSLEVDTVGLGLDWTRAVGSDHFLTFGLDLANDDVDSFGKNKNLSTGDSMSAEGDFAPNARYGRFGLFARDELTMWAPTYVTLGLRYSAFWFAFDRPAAPDEGRERGSFDDLTATLEVARDLDDDVRLTARLAQGFQAPNLEDLANEGQFAGGTELANPELDPARSWMAELGVDVRKARWAGTAAVFFTRIDDYIGRRLVNAGDPGVAGDETYQRANAGRLDLWGVELSAQRALFAPDSGWRIEGVASWVRGRQHDDTLDRSTGDAPLDGVEARRVPPLSGHLTLAWHDPSQRPAGTHDRAGLDAAALSVVLANEQRQLHPDDVSDPRIDPNGTPGWATLNLDFRGRLRDGVEWSLGFRNLFDAAYRVHGSGLDGPGRSVVAGLRLHF